MQEFYLKNSRIYDFYILKKIAIIVKITKNYVNFCKNQGQILRK